jgi:NAD-dependent dihydropyrimidine dehydrogenase PreA subunit/flavodoxin
MIFFFSGTGNSRWAAEEIAKATGEQLLFIPEEMKGKCEYEVKEDERIGFIFPTHGWQPPRIVRNFIGKLKLKNISNQYCFALTTCGDSIGQTMEILNNDLEKCGLPITTSVFTLIMPESYVCLPFMYTDTPEREKEKIAKASQLLKDYTEMIVERKKNIVQTVKGVAPWAMSHIVGNYFNGRMISDKKFTVDLDKCIHCGKCEKACPTGDIKLNDGTPDWQHNGSCTCCLACYHHCPQHAINYGSITRKRSQYYFGHK